MANLVTPSIPIDYIQDFYSQCAAECITRALNNGEHSADLEAVFDVIVYFNALKQEADEQGGLLPKASDKAARKWMLMGWAALRELGFLS